MYSPALIADFYKHSHAKQYPAGTEFVYSNTTPRGSRMDGVKSVVVFGNQYLVKKYLLENWNHNFFNRPKSVVINELKRVLNATLGNNAVDFSLFEELHDLGYLPLHIKGLPEGTLCPVRVPMSTIINTDKRFYWLTNFVETLTQTVVWQMITSATVALEYKKILQSYALKTSDCPEFVQFQAHDFSMRGMSSVESGAVSGMGHLLSFYGTDTITAILAAEEFYNADVEKELVGTSVPATEHAVMCAGGETDERETFRRIIEDIYPSGIVSVVSDTWDFWHVLTNILPSLQDEIMKRDGKVVIRPDSGDPVKIVTGYFLKAVALTSEDYLVRITRPAYHQKVWADDSFDAVKTLDGKCFDVYGKELSAEEVMGAVQILFEEFGGKINSKGYTELDSHIGLIYGDSITLSRCEQICERLARKGFASTNVVFGVGSYTYQYNTRDTFSIACKATWVQIDGAAKPIFKDPKTDGGMKKSAKGLLRVVRKNDELVLEDEVSPELEQTGELQTIFLNGKMYNETSLSEIRERLNAEFMSITKA